MTDKILLPPHVAACCETLRQAGHRACPVGGCVRDSLLGRAPGDWDVATSARPEQTAALFPRAIPTGARHGTVTVSTPDGPIEVTSFRREGSYADSRHPDGVEFGVTLEEDLARRDFTINAMALDENGTVVDLFGGRTDLKGRLIRCVGDPDARFQEDALRMLRAVRFAAQLCFELDGGAAAAIRRNAHFAARLSPERVRAELERTLLSSRPELSAAFFDFGLISGLPARRPIDADRLARLPAQPLLRWAGLCGCLLDSAMTGSCAGFLSSLRSDRKTLRACAAGETLRQAGIPQDTRQWRRALAVYGTQGCRAAAAMEGGGALSELEAVLAASPAVTTGQLALSGGELAGLGLSGPAIGAAQRRLLDHVLDHPEDNTWEKLRKILEHTQHI